jgi:hypothetical protein
VKGRKVLWGDEFHHAVGDRLSVRRDDWSGVLRSLGVVSGLEGGVLGIELEPYLGVTRMNGGTSIFQEGLRVVGGMREGCESRAAAAILISSSVTRLLGPTCLGFGVIRQGWL